MRRILAIAAVLLLASCVKTPKETPVSGVELSESSIELSPGQTRQLTATVTPDDATDKSVSWTSAVPSVATVDDNGLVTAVAAGASTITVTTRDGEYKASCSVIVKRLERHVQSVSLSMSSVGLTVGGSVIIGARVLPADADDTSVSWSAEPASVVKVEQDGFNGIVSATGPGEGKVTVTTRDGGFSASCKVTVEEETVSVESVALDSESLELFEGESARLTATVFPENATDKTLQWRSLDEGVATVDEEGNVTAIAAGKTSITVTALDGAKTASCEVTVKKIQVDAVSVNPASLTLKEGETAQLQATVSPADASQDVQWASEDTRVATVDASGLVSAVAPGSTRIFARSVAFPDKQAPCEVTVTPDTALKGIELSSAVMTLQVGESRTLTVSFNPDYAANKKVSWASSDPSVAAVDAEGTVTAFSEGSATVTAIAEDGGHSASCAVTVSGSAGAMVYYWKESKVYLNGAPDPRNGMYDTESFYFSAVDHMTSFGNTLYTLEWWYENGHSTLWLCRDRKPAFKLPSVNNIYGFQVNEKGFAILYPVVSQEKMALLRGDFSGNQNTVPITGSFNRYYYASIALCPDGSAVVAAYIRDSFGSKYVATYIVTPGGDVKEKLVEKNDLAKPRVAVSASGDYYMLFARYDSEGKEEIVLFKNGVQEAVIDKVEYNYDGAIACSGNHVYTAVRDFVGEQIRIRRDGELIYTIDTQDSIYYSDIAPLQVTPSGDVYLAVAGDGRRLYKNGELLYSDPGDWTFLTYVVIE